jgi:hypothetical protein
MTKTRSTRMGACAALAMATASIASTSIPSIAAAQERDRVWALDCTLSDDTVEALKKHMNDAAPEKLTGEGHVAFVVIYSFEENGGQQLTVGGFTGPVICRNTDVVPEIDQVLQTDNTPTTDLRDVANAIILRYGTANIEQRYCYTVGAKQDCFHLR